MPAEPDSSSDEQPHAGQGYQEDIRICLTHTTDDEQYALTLKHICKSLEQREVTLEMIVTQLGDNLTSKDRVLQLKAISILYHLIRDTRAAAFIQAEAEYLVEFFAKRLADSFLIPAKIAQTLLILVKRWQFSSALVQQLVTSIFREVEMSQQNGEIRFTFYQIFGQLFQTCLASLQEMKHNFVHGFVRLIENEKDPRCLLVIFELHQLVCANFNIKIFITEMFEVVSCYFPISYNPPKERNPLQITRQNLVDALKRTLTQEKGFAPFLIPLIIEKLEAPTDYIKIDCYQMLVSACSIYSAEQFQESYNELWQIMQADCLQKDFKTLSQLEFCAKEALIGITRCIRSNTDIFSSWIQLIRNDLEPYLQNFELNQFYAACAVLSKLAGTSTDLANLVELIAKSLRQTLLTLTDDSAVNTKKQIEVLKAIDIFAREIRDFYDDQQTSSEAGETGQSKVKAELDLLFESIISKILAYNFDYDFYNAYLACLQQLILISSLQLTREQLSDFTHKVIMLVEDHSNQKIRPTLLELFNVIVHRYSTYCREQVYPYLVRKLRSNDGMLVKMNLFRMARYCDLGRNHLFLFQMHAADYLKRDDLVFGTINQVILESLATFHAKYPTFHDPLLRHFLIYCLNSLYNGDNNLEGLRNSRYIFEVFLLSSYHLSRQEAARLMHFLTEIIFLRTPENNFLDHEPVTMEQNFDLDNFKTRVNIYDGCTNQVVFIHILHSLTSRLDMSDVASDIAIGLLDKFIDLLFGSYFTDAVLEAHSSQHTLEIIETFVAKFAHDAAFSAHLSNKIKLLSREYLVATTVSKKLIFINLFRSMTKALVHVQSSLYKDSLTFLVNLFTLTIENELLRYFVISFWYIVNNAQSQRFSPEYHVQCHRYINQRFFALSTQKLLGVFDQLEYLYNKNLEMYPMLKSENRQSAHIKTIVTGAGKPQMTVLNSLVGTIVSSIEKKLENEKQRKELQVLQRKTFTGADAIDAAAGPISEQPAECKQLMQSIRLSISYCILVQLSQLPKLLIKTELNRLQKVVYNVLFDQQMSDIDICMQTQLNCVRCIVDLKPDMLQARLAEIVKYLLLNLRKMKKSRIKCQIFECLALLPRHYKEIDLIQLQKKVLNELDTDLDDQKRVVRYAAVKTKCRWILIGQPV